MGSIAKCFEAAKKKGVSNEILDSYEIDTWVERSKQLQQEGKTELEADRIVLREMRKLLNEDTRKFLSKVKKKGSPLGRKDAKAYAQETRQKQIEEIESRRRAELSKIDEKYGAVKEPKKRRPPSGRDCRVCGPGARGGSRARGGPRNLFWEKVSDGSSDWHCCCCRL